MSDTKHPVFIEEAVEFTEADYRKLLAIVPESQKRTWLSREWVTVSVVEAAVLAERERCAKVAEEYAHGGDPMFDSACELIAERIRGEE